MLSTSLVDQIAAFIASNEPLRAAWLNDDIMKVYLRRSRRAVLVDGKVEAHQTLDLATIEVREEHRRKGLFAATVDHLMAVSPFPLLYVENAAEMLLPCLERRGFIERDRFHGLHASMYRMLPINR